jgi:hypothetical protein
MNKLFFFILLFSNLRTVDAQKIFFTISARQNYSIMGNKSDTIGLYRGYSGDPTWTHLAWLNEISYGIAVRDSIYFLSGLDGVLRSTDHGINWKVVTTWRIPEAFQVYFHPELPHTVYLICSNGVWKSEDLGETWNEFNAGLKSTSQKFVNKLLILPGGLLACTADGIYERKNDSRQWDLFAWHGKEVNDICLDPHNRLHLLAAMEDSGLEESFDGGKTWNMAGTGLAQETIYSIAFDPLQKGTVYCGGYKLGLCKYNADTRQWGRLENNVSGKSIHSIAIDPFHSEKIYLGLIDSGLFYSPNKGEDVSCIAEANGKIWQVLIVP